ncbi:MAG: hypothetical protein P4L46_07920 [Fimbriimonas sp.]|nr:hypothetical protein [Fimbriimonas sp.]
MIALLTTLFVAHQAFSQPPTSKYTNLDFSGFTILVSPSAESAKDTLKPALDLLAYRLRQVKQEVPPAAFKELVKVRFWVELNDPKTTAAYHPDAQWLRSNGYNPDMAHGIEIGNLHNFLAWQHIQPSMVLHELAHSYHFLHIGENDPTISAAYDHAVSGGKYDSVPFVTGGLRKAYALTNRFEYFAECSEAYFGRNDFYPFIRSDLKKFDPEGYSAVERAWGINR